MAHIQQDSELFTNLVSASPIPAGRAFTSFRDDNGRPGIISLSEKGKLQLFTEYSGRLVNRDFAVECGINGTVTAFAAKQQADSSLFIAFAYQNNSSYELAILPKLPVEGLAAPSSLSPVQVIKSDLKLTEVRGVWLTNYANARSSAMGIDYPDIVFSYQPVGRFWKQADCGLLEVVAEQGKQPVIQQSSKWSLPTTVDEIVDLDFCRSTVGDGIAIIYKNTTKALYSTYSGSKYNVAFSIPPGATCLASYLDESTKLSNLLVGSKTLNHLTPYQYVKTNQPGKVVSGIIIDEGVKDLHIAQNQTAITAWFTNVQNAAGYYQVPKSTGFDKGTVVPVLVPGKGGRLSAMISATSMGDEIQLVNTVVSVDENANLTSLQQESQNGSWTSYPIIQSTSTENFDVESYTTRLKIMEDAETPCANGSFMITSTGRTPAILNGRQVTIEAGGTIVQTDHNGEATFIAATSDIATQIYEISNIQTSSGKQVQITPVKVDPMSKARQKMSEIRNGKDLRDATLPDGQRLVDTSQVDEETIEKAGEFIGQLTDEALRLGSVRTQINNKLTRLRSSREDGLGSFPSDAWAWVTGNVKKAIKWTIKTGKDGLEFVVELAEGAYRFLLDTIHAIGKALSWIWDKLKVALKKLIKFLGWFFGWDDIIDTQQSMLNFTKATMKYTSGKIGEAQSKVDEMSQFLKQQLRTLSSPINEGKISDTPVDIEKEQSSIGYNWMNYQLVHGGAMQKFQVKPSKNKEIESFGDIIVKAGTDLQNDFDKLGQDVINMFRGMGRNVSIQNIISLIVGDMALLAVDVMTGVAKGALSAAKSMIDLILEYATTPINIPILTPLWDLIGEGDLTILGCICLVLAAPATLAAKYFAGHAPPDISGMMDGDDGVKVIASYVDGSIKDSDRSKINELAAWTAVSASGIGVAVSSVVLALSAIPALAPNVLDSESHMPDTSTIIGDPILLDYHQDNLARIVRGFNPVLAAADTCYFLVAVVNWGVAVPLNTTDKKQLKWITWALGGCKCAGMLVAILIGQFITGKAKEALVGVNGSLGLFTFAAQLVLYVETGPNPNAFVEVQRIVLASLSWIANVCRQAAAMMDAEGPLFLIPYGIYLMTGKFMVKTLAENVQVVVKNDALWIPALFVI